MCDLVGNSFVMTAVLKPSATRPNAARRPAPPTKNNSLQWILFKCGAHICSTYQHLQRLHRTHDQQLCTPLIWHRPLFLRCALRNNVNTWHRPNSILSGSQNWETIRSQNKINLSCSKRPHVSQK